MANNPKCISKDGYDAIVGAEIGLLKQTKITIINIIQMQQIKNSYLIGTKYGINMVVELHNGEWYQQIHVSLNSVLKAIEVTDLEERLQNIENTLKRD